MIELKNLSKLYESREGNVMALNNVDLRIEEGEIYGVMGLSGAGKSTLIRCINLLEPPTTGEVWVDGILLTELPARSLRQSRKNMGMIFQSYNLLTSRTVEKNIAFPLEIHKTPKDQINQRVDELLHLVGLEDRRKYYPSQLSGGQRQRVAIARALATNPKILLSDEATSALDPITSRNILNLLREINNKLGITIVLITHEIQVIEHICDRVGVLKDGKIIEEGPVKRVFNKANQPYTQLLLGKEGKEKSKAISLNSFRGTKAGGL